MQEQSQRSLTAVHGGGGLLQISHSVIHTLHGLRKVDVVELSSQSVGVLQHGVNLDQHLRHLMIQLCRELVQLTGGSGEVGGDVLNVSQRIAYGRVGEQRVHRREDGVKLRQHQLYLWHHGTSLAHQPLLCTTFDGVATLQQVKGVVSKTQLQLYVAQQVAGNLGTCATRQLHLTVQTDSSHDIVGP